MAKWPPANRFRAALETRFSADVDYLGYVAEASGTGLDTRQDRIVEIYRYLREEADPATWHRDEGLRAFIAATQAENPYIPDAVRQREFESRAVPPSPRAFLPKWEEAGHEVREVLIDVEDFESTMQSAPDIIDAFKRNNLHDTSYFFTKLAEWYITLEAHRQTGGGTLADIGAAYHGFAKVATATRPELNVLMVDLLFAPGRARFAERIEQVGADAGALDIFEDESVDIVCAHNAFEHFSGSSDSNCAGEIARILRPGGKALISPLFADEVYSLSINPFSCFVTADGDELSQQIVEELSEPRVRVDYRPNIISPYSRRYDLTALESRVLSRIGGLKPCLLVPRFREEGFEKGVYHRPVLGCELKASVFDQRVFYCLELTKPQ